MRRRRWLWVTFVSAAIAYLLFMGPVEVLVPYVVKHDLGGTASDLGLIFGAGGLASILTAMALGQLGLPRRSMTFIYGAWTVATLAVVGYGVGTAVWHFMLASAVFNALETALSASSAPATRTWTSSTRPRSSRTTQGPAPDLRVVGARI